MANFKTLLNAAEAATSRQLDDIVARHGARVFAKPRMADVLPIARSGVADEDFSFALRAHFDFVVSDGQYRPLFAVEFDGPQHLSAPQAARDARKDALCDRFGFPILRIRTSHLSERYRGLLLAWFIEVWFAAREFEHQQAEGLIPNDEPFDPTFFATLPGYGRSFPLMLSAASRTRIRALFLSGQVHDFGPSFFVGTDGKGAYRALGWIMITADSGVIARTAMRAQRFPAREWEALREIVQCDVEQELQRFLRAAARHCCGSKWPKRWGRSARATGSFRL